MANKLEVNQMGGVGENPDLPARSGHGSRGEIVYTVLSLPETKEVSQRFKNIRDVKLFFEEKAEVLIGWMYSLQLGSLSIDASGLTWDRLNQLDPVLQQAISAVLAAIMSTGNVTQDTSYIVASTLSVAGYTSQYLPDIRLSPSADQILSRYARAVDLTVQMLEVIAREDSEGGLPRLPKSPRNKFQVVVKVGSSYYETLKLEDEGEILRYLRLLGDSQYKDADIQIETLSPKNDDGENKEVCFWQKVSLTDPEYVKKVRHFVIDHG